MKPTEITDRNIEIIKKSIDLLVNISNIEHYWILYRSSDNIISLLRTNLSDLESISCSDISKEFLASCNNVDEIEGLRQVFKIRFKKILEWISNSPIDLKNSSIENAIALNHLLFVIGTNEEPLPEDKRLDIFDLYIKNFLNLAKLKKDLLELFEEWEAMSLSSLNKIINDELEQKETSFPSKFRIAQNRKTDFLKILSSMYDCRIFETEKGYIASNKQELMNEFGRFLGQDFSNYSASLTQSKTAQKESFFKPFTDIRKKAEEYYER